MIKIAFTEYRFALSAERAVIYHVKVDVFSARQREGIFTWLWATATNGSTEMSFVVTAALVTRSVCQPSEKIAMLSAKGRNF